MLNDLPDDLNRMIISLCDNKIIIKFQDIYPELLKSIHVDDVKEIKKENHKYIKKIRASKEVTDIDLKSLSNLQILFCLDNKNFTDEGLKSLSNLQKLDCRDNKNFTDEGLKSLVNLQELYCGYNKNFTDDALKNIKFVYKQQ